MPRKGEQRPISGLSLNTEAKLRALRQIEWCDEMLLSAHLSLSFRSQLQNMKQFYLSILEGLNSEQ